MRYTGPRNRLSRREGMDLGLKTAGSNAQASLLKKINVPPGQHGAKGKRKLSEHAKQLREKQKLRSMCGLSEKQLKNYFGVASKKKGNTGVLLCELLERRLDAIVHRMGLAPTRAAARQLITHKHIKVNEKMNSIPSYNVRVNDMIALRKDATKAIPYIETSISQKDVILPAWVERDGAQGKMIANPSSEIIEKQINLRLVIEFYSR